MFIKEVHPLLYDKHFGMNEYNELQKKKNKL